VLGLSQKRRNAVRNLSGNVGVIRVARFGAGVAIPMPGRPIAKQQPLLVSRADQILEGHPIYLVRRRSALPDEAPKHTMAQFIGELEPLDESIAQLVVPRLAPMASQTFA
jgi:hypothetical protein